jgi:hypothetical protein
MWFPQGMRLTANWRRRVTIARRGSDPALLCALVVASSALLCVPSSQAQSKAGGRKERASPVANIYDGNWWELANSDTRSGFFWGTADCLVWEAHQKGFSGSFDDFATAVSNFYKAHPAERSLPVVDAWRRSAAGKRPHEASSRGEVYRNPHWDLDGLWYRQAPYDQRIGFLDGYIGCWRAYVQPSKDTYAKPSDYYDRKVWNYISAHPEADRKPIAGVLALFQDKPRPH